MKTEQLLKTNKKQTNTHTCLKCQALQQVTIPTNVQEFSVYNCNSCDNNYMYTRPNPKHNVFNNVPANAWVEIKIKS